MKSVKFYRKTLKKYFFFFCLKKGSLGLIQCKRFTKNCFGKLSVIYSKKAWSKTKIAILTTFFSACIFCQKIIRPKNVFGRSTKLIHTSLPQTIFRSVGKLLSGDTIFPTPYKSQSQFRLILRKAAWPKIYKKWWAVLRN